MKKILLFDVRNPSRRPHRLTVDDAIASAAVRSGVAAAANPSEHGALASGGALSPDNPSTVLLQTGEGGTIRVGLPAAVIAAGAALGLIAGITGAISGGTPTPTPTPTPGPETLIPPAALVSLWAIPYTATRGTDGTYAINMDISSFRPANPGRILYVVPGSASGNDGLSQATAVPDLGNALGKAQAGDEIRIILTADTVARSTGAWPATPGPAFNVAVVNTTPQFRYILAAAASGTLQTWSQNGTYANVSQCTVALPNSVTDARVKFLPFRQTSGGTGYAVGDVLTLSNGARITVTGVASGSIRTFKLTRLPNAVVTGALTATGGSGTGAAFRSADNAPKAFGVGQRLTTSIADVAANPGTWYHDGTVLYFSTLDGRTITGTDPLVILNVNNRSNLIVSTPGVSVYVSGIDTVGGQNGIVSGYTGTTRAQIALNDCTAQAAGTNGISTNSSARVFGYRSAAYHNGADGFSLHNAGGPTETGTSGSMLLVEPFAMGNGAINSVVSAASDNDYTGHEESVMVLVSPFSGGSDDRCFGFIDNSVTWAMGGFVGTAKTAADAGVTTSNSIDLQNSAQIFLDGTEVLPSASPSEAYAPKTGTKLYYRNITPAPTTSQAGTIATY